MTITRFSFYLRLLLSLGLVVVGMPIPASDQESDIQAKRAIIKQLKNLKLAELIEVETFNPKARSAARKVQKLSETAAALFVLTQEDLRRAGVTRIAEALRLVPGVQVARIDANKWAISARGLNGQYASKLLVMIDGRSVYTQLRSEVYWDVQDLLIEDIERIEVIRGPGASLWGANAVNGVINIITKAATETQGNLITAYHGQGEEQNILGLQHGGKLDNGLAYRVYGKFYDHDNFLNAQGQDQHDDWQMKRGGMRMDWEKSETEKMTLQTDAYSGQANQTVFVTNPFVGVLNDEVNTNGVNVLGRWERDLEHGDMILQAYYDHTHREDASLEETRNTYDLDFQHRWQRNETQELIWGLGFRQTRDDITSSPSLSYDPPRRTNNLASAFVQGELTWQPWRFTLGSKFEYTDTAGLEIQPTLRVLWSHNAQHNFWAAISRAIRAPSRSDQDGRTETLSFNGITKLKALASEDFKAEQLLAYELGYRFTPIPQFLLDTTIFFNQYDDLRNVEQTGFDPYSRPPTVFLRSNNNMYGEIYGAELALHWQVLPTWKVIGSYSYLDVQLHLNGSSPLGEQEEGDTPNNQATLQSQWSLPQHLEFDTAWYYVDNVSNQKVPRYHRFDLRLGWKPLPTLEVSAGVRNLFDPQHREFGNMFSGNTVIANEVPRAVYLQLKYRF